ncbi:hypothetical protein E2C01_090175 [Portunus trituberculatus]|uniref:Uncharacterized protein n=1 Tax=Portunus trituberculatus TaxID=210409 RepID=A0A5B7JKP7_PORTR|nr:hypothetical protein [Portunus trituberculatus]
MLTSRAASCWKASFGLLGTTPSGLLRLSAPADFLSGCCWQTESLRFYLSSFFAWPRQPLCGRMMFFATFYILFSFSRLRTLKTYSRSCLDLLPPLEASRDPEFPLRTIRDPDIRTTAREKTAPSLRDWTANTPRAHNSHGVPSSAKIMEGIFFQLEDRHSGGHSVSINT